MKCLTYFVVSIIVFSTLLISCSKEYDLVIQDGIIYDGSGEAPFIANIGITDGKIVEIGDFDANGKEVIDAKGLMVSPGFIDIHTHIDRGIVRPEGSMVQNYLTKESQLWLRGIVGQVPGK